TPGPLPPATPTSASASPADVAVPTLLDSREEKAAREKNSLLEKQSLPRSRFSPALPVKRFWPLQIAEELAGGAEAGFESAVDGAAAADQAGGFAGEEEGVLLGRGELPEDVVGSACELVGVRAAAERILAPVHDAGAFDQRVDLPARPAEHAGDRVERKAQAILARHPLGCGAAGPAGQERHVARRAAPPGGKRGSGRMEEVRLAQLPRHPERLAEPEQRLDHLARAHPGQRLALPAQR